MKFDQINTSKSNTYPSSYAKRGAYPPLEGVAAGRGRTSLKEQFIPKNV
jgi:hypothetical protein